MTRTQKIEALAERLGRQCHGEQFDVVLDTLVFLLAAGGAQISLDKREFLALVYEKLDSIYVQHTPGEDDGDSTFQ